MRRLPLTLLLALGVSLPTAAPAAAAVAYCSSDSAHPGELRVVASGYRGNEATSYVFYVSGPERRSVYVGNDPQLIDETLSGLEPGRYQWSYDITVHNDDGTTTVGTKLLNSCTVYGSKVPAPTAPPSDESGSLTVPDLIGLDLRPHALDRVGDFTNVVVKEVVSKARFGLGVAQSLAAGSKADPDDRLVLSVSKGTSESVVPTPAPAATPTPAPTTTPVASATPAATPSESTAAIALAVEPTPQAPADGGTTATPLVDLDLSNLGAVVAGGLAPLALLALLVLIRRRRAA